MITRTSRIFTSWVCLLALVTSSLALGNTPTATPDSNSFNEIYQAISDISASYKRSSPQETSTEVNTEEEDIDSSGSQYPLDSFDELQETINNTQEDLNRIFRQWRNVDQEKETDTSSALSSLEEKLEGLKKPVEKMLREELSYVANHNEIPYPSRISLKEKYGYGFFNKDADKILELYLELYISVITKYAAMEPERLEDINSKMALSIPTNGENLPSYRGIVAKNLFNDDGAWHIEPKHATGPLWQTEEKDNITISVSHNYIKNAREKRGKRLRIALAKDEETSSNEEPPPDKERDAQWWRNKPLPPLPDNTPYPFQESRMERLLLDTIKQYLIENLREDLATTEFILGLRILSEDEKERNLRLFLYDELQHQREFVELFIYGGVDPEAFNRNRASYLFQRTGSFMEEAMGFPRAFADMSEKELQEAFCEILIRSRLSSPIVTLETDDTHDCEVELAKINFTEVIDRIKKGQNAEFVFDSMVTQVTDIKRIYDDNNTPLFQRQKLDARALAKYTGDRLNKRNFQAEDEQLFNFLNSMPASIRSTYRPQFYVDATSKDVPVEERLYQRFDKCRSLDLESAYSQEYLICLNKTVLWANADDERKGALTKFIQENEEDKYSKIIDDFYTIQDEPIIRPSNDREAVQDLGERYFPKHTNGSIEFDLDPNEQLEIFKNYSFYNRVKELPILGITLNNIRKASRRKAWLDTSCSPFDSNSKDKAICQQIVYPFFLYRSVREDANKQSETGLDEKKFARTMEIAQLLIERGRKKQALFEALSEDDEEQNRAYVELALWQNRYELKSQISAVEKWSSLRHAQAVAKHSILDKLLSNHSLLSSTYLSWREEVEERFPYRNNYKLASQETLFLHNADMTKAEIAITAVNRRVLFFGFLALLTFQLGRPFFSNCLRLHRVGALFAWVYQGVTMKGIENFSRVAVGMILTDIGIFGNHTLFRYPREYRLLKTVSMGNPYQRLEDGSGEIEPLEPHDLAMMEETLIDQRRRFRNTAILEALYLVQFLGHIPAVQTQIRNAFDKLRSYRHNLTSKRINRAFDDLGVGPEAPTFIQQNWSWNIDSINRIHLQRVSQIRAGIVPVRGTTHSAIRRAKRAHKFLIKKIRQVEKTWTRYAKANTPHFRRLRLDVGVDGWREFARLDRRRITDDLARESIEALDNFLKKTIYDNPTVTIEEYSLVYNMLFGARGASKLDDSKIVFATLSNRHSYWNDLPARNLAVRVPPIIMVRPPQ